MHKLLLTLVLFFVSFASVACRMPLTPKEQDLPNYTSIFIGEVTGIHLTSYEDFRLGKSDFYPISSTADYSAQVVVSEVLQGKPAPALRLKLGGCGVGIPALNDFGIFFVGPDGITAIPIWRKDKDEYQRWLKLIKSHSQTANPSSTPRVETERYADSAPIPP